jgi:hypothetical protein
MRLAVAAVITAIVTAVPAPTISALPAAPATATIEAEPTERSRISHRRLPSGESVGATRTTDHIARGRPFLCMQPGSGPVPRRHVSRNYWIEGANIRVHIRTYRDASTARAGLRAQRRDVLALCDGWVFSDQRLDYRRAPVALRGFGDQRWGLAFDQIPLVDGFLPASGLEGAYRVGRHLVLYATWDSYFDPAEPDGGRRIAPQILSVVRDRIESLPS